MACSILVPLDGSALGEQALPTAICLGRRLNAQLRLVHVHSAAAGLESGRAISIHTDLRRELQEHSEDYLASVVARIREAAPDVAVETAVLEGAIAETIERQATTSACDIVVMTTHGRGMLARAWLGSVADALVRRLSIPILLVRPQETPPELTREPPLQRVLVPLDGSALSEQVLERIVSLGVPPATEFTLLQVVTPILPGVSLEDLPARPDQAGDRRSRLQQLRTMYEEEVQKSHEYLARVADRLRTSGATVQTHVIEHQQPATAILNAAQANSSDVIALATHGHGGLQRLLMGSVTDKVLRGSEIPVLVLRPAGSPAVE